MSSPIKPSNPFAPFVPDDFLLDQAAFSRSLSLERRRTERTGDPFVLMVMNLASLNGATPWPRVAAICAVLKRESRDTDIYGWYEAPHTIGALFTALRGVPPDSIIAALSAKIERALQEVLDPEEISQVSVTYHFFPEADVQSDGTLYPDLKSRDKSRKSYNRLKRVIDVAGSVCGLALFAPVLLLIALLVRLTSRGPILFRQRRIGRYGREFWFLKFRSMRVNNDPTIHEQYIKQLIENPDKQSAYKIQNDPRITPFGRFLRKSSLDELPQLLNVLTGDMSLVGPRPPLPYEVANYRYWHRRRVVEVKPGITGLWQVYGRSRTTFDEMVRLDLRYVQQQSLLLDLKILLLTPYAVISGRGAY